MDLYLSASYRLEIDNEQHLKNYSRILFEDRFNVHSEKPVFKNSSDYKKFESNVRQVKTTLIGASVLPSVSQGDQGWVILSSQFNKSKAVIMKDQELISSLLDTHEDLEDIFTQSMRKKIKEFINDACREYVKRNAFKVITFFLKIHELLRNTFYWSI